MVTDRLSLEEYRADLARRGMPPDARLERLLGQSEALRTRLWTDEQLREIPDELIHFAFEQSDALQQEFRDLPTLLAYRKARGQGSARIYGGGQTRS